MPLQSSGAISLNDLHIEAGGTSGTTVSLNDADIRDLGGLGRASGAIARLSDYYGLSRLVAFTYEIIGGGGGGGYGRSDDGFAGSGNGNSGTASTIVPTGTGSSEISSGTDGYFVPISAAGGTGGENTSIAYNVLAGRDGDASHYGPGGAGGTSGAGGGVLAGSPAPADSYGAGGGGGGGDAPGTFDSSGAAGEGGDAGTRKTGTVLIPYGKRITITAGTGGATIIGNQGRNGGAGGSGYVKVTRPDGKTYTVYTGATLVTSGNDLVFPTDINFAII